MNENYTHWSLDDIPWDKFDPAKVDPHLVPAVKAAAMVEANSGDYVTYLNKVLNPDAKLKATVEQWGREEVQHGEALGRWAELADPTFSFADALKEFQAGYSLPLEAETSVRGSRTGEMVSRCVIECGTSSYYTAMKDRAQEPVLKFIAQKIAADEFRHYKLFYEVLGDMQKAEGLTTWGRISVALGRVFETEDDELAMAYWSANEAPKGIPYDHARCMGEYHSRAIALYERHHAERAAQMIAKAVGLTPHKLPANLISTAFWAGLKLQKYRADRLAA
ncbi:MAG: ferritin family protein [Alphaproteobacteria bacterium]